MEKNTRSLTVKQEINASPETIYSMLTDADQMIKWFPTRAESDPVVGGHYMLEFDFTGPVARTHVTKGEFLELIPGRRVRYTWSDAGTEVHFEITRKGDKSELTLVHSGFRPAEENDTYESTSRGWTFFMANLKAFLESGKDSRTGVW